MKQRVVQKGLVCASMKIVLYFGTKRKILLNKSIFCFFMSYTMSTNERSLKNRELWGRAKPRKLTITRNERSHGNWELRETSEPVIGFGICQPTGAICAQWGIRIIGYTRIGQIADAIGAQRGKTNAVIGQKLMSGMRDHFNPNFSFSSVRNMEYG